MNRRLKCDYCNSGFDEDWVETDCFGDKRCPVCGDWGYIFDTKTLELIYGKADGNKNDDDD